MNKLIKAAIIMASVGAMLFIVGCGKELTPTEKADKQIAAFCALVTDCGGVIPQSFKDDLAKASEAQKIEGAEKIATAFPRVKKYCELLKEFNAFCRKTGGEPAIKGEEMLDRLMDLIMKGPQKLDSEIEKIELAFSKLKKYNELLKEFNVLCQKTGGKPEKEGEVMERLCGMYENPARIDSEIKDMEKGLDWLRTAAAEKK